MRAREKIYFKLFGFFAVFLSAAITAGAIWYQLSTGKTVVEHRAPASVFYDDDGEIVDSETSLSDLEVPEHVRPHARKKTAYVGGPVFEIQPQGGDSGILSPSEALRKSGVAAIRGRRVLFNVASFETAVNNRDRRVSLPLFDDVTLVGVFQAPSVYKVNQGIYSGQVDGDPDSRIHLFVSDGKMNGVIETNGHGTFRIFEGGDGNHYVVEEKTSRH